MMPPGAPIVTAAAMRAAEEAAFAAGLDAAAAAMERAGLAVAQAARRFAGDRSILILAGPGNNGGDGYVAARLLAEWGHDVTVAAAAPPATDTARRAAAGWTGPTRSLAEAPPRPFVIDALFGIGLSRPLDADVAAALCRMRNGAEMLAVDLPSGLATDTGSDLGAAGADVTLALGALKPAHVLAQPTCGAVLLADIGVPVLSPHRTIVRPTIAAPAPDAHKYRAMVAVIAGAMPGAARLAARGAAGAGYVVLAGATAPRDGIVRRDDVAAILTDTRVGAVVVGPGLGRDDAARALLDRALVSDRPLVLDGDALSLLAGDAAERVRARNAETVLTPHGGEFVRMFGSAHDRLAATIDAAAACRATIVHKGHATIVADRDGGAIVSVGAPSWLAVAGSGDVLAGAVAARLAGGGHPAEAVWLHGAAARLAGAAFSADDLADRLAAAIAQCR